MSASASSPRATRDRFVIPLDGRHERVGRLPAHRRDTTTPTCDAVRQRREPRGPRRTTAGRSGAHRRRDSTRSLRRRTGGTITASGTARITAPDMYVLAVLAGRSRSLSAGCRGRPRSRGRARIRPRVLDDRDRRDRAVETRARSRRHLAATRGACGRHLAGAARTARSTRLSPECRQADRRDLLRAGERYMSLLLRSLSRNGVGEAHAPVVLVRGRSQGARSARRSRHPRVRPTVARDAGSLEILPPVEGAGSPPHRVAHAAPRRGVPSPDRLGQASERCRVESIPRPFV